jgi:hypothetical protein
LIETDQEGDRCSGTPFLPSSDSLEFSNTSKQSDDDGSIEPLEVASQFVDVKLLVGRGNEVEVLELRTLVGRCANLDMVDLLEEFKT